MNFQEIAVKVFQQAAAAGVVVFNYKGQQRVCTSNRNIINAFLERPSVRGELSYQDFIPKDDDLKGMLMLELTRGSELTEAPKRFNFDKIEWSV